MKRWVRISMVAVLLMGVFSLTVYAQTASEAEQFFNDQLVQSGASALYDDLPEDTRRMFEKLGVDAFSFDALLSLQPQTALSTLGDLLSEETSAPFQAALSMLGVMLLLGFFSMMGVTNTDHGMVFRVVATLAVVTPMLVPLWQTVQRVQAASDSATVFSLSFTPVYAGILAAGGGTVSAASFQTSMLAAAEGISLLIGSVIIPLASVAFAIGICGGMHCDLHLGEVGALCNRVVVWILGISLTIFVGILSLQGVLSATADSVGGRMMRFSVAGFVPIVGGSLSEALYVVRGCLSALKGSVGGFGILVTVLTVLPPLIECVAWDLLLVLTRTCAMLFSFSELVAVCDAAKSLVKILIAVLASSGLLVIIALTVVSLAGGGAI